MNTKLKHTILAISSLFILFSTLFIYTKVDSRDELQAVKLGYPAYFLEQNFSAQYGKSPFFPTWEKVDLRGRSPVVKFHLARMAVDFLLIFSICEGVFYILEIIDFAIRKEKTS